MSNTILELVNPTKVEETYLNSMVLWMEQHSLAVIDFRNEFEFNKQRIKHLQQLNRLIEQDLEVKGENIKAVVNNLNEWVSNCNKEKEISINTKYECIKELTIADGENGFATYEVSREYTYKAIQYLPKETIKEHFKIIE